jgi:hypothetical protein
MCVLGVSVSMCVLGVSVSMCVRGIGKYVYVRGIGFAALLTFFCYWIFRTVPTVWYLLFII